MYDIYVFDHLVWHSWVVAAMGLATAAAAWQHQNELRQQGYAKVRIRRST